MEKKKIFMTGMLSSEYVRTNWLVTMRRMFDVTYVSSSILLRAMPLSDVTDYLLRIFNEGEFDYAFFYPDNVHQMFEERLFEEIRKKVPVITFYPDDEPEFWLQNNLPADHRSDLIVTQSKRGYEYRLNNGINEHIMNLQWGYDPSLYFKTGEEKTCDVLFIGSNFISAGGYFYDGFIRQEILCRVYEFCKKNGYSFRLYGSRWDQHQVLKECCGGFLPDDEVNSVINSAKVVLGLGYTADEKPTYQTKLRHFEVAGTGTFELVNRNPDIEEIFGDSMGQFDGPDDVVEKLEYFLSNDNERESKAKKAYDIAISSCKMEDRIKEIFEKAEEVFKRGQKPSDSIAEAKSFSPLGYGKAVAVLDHNDSLIRTARNGSFRAASLISVSNDIKNPVDTERRAFDDAAVVEKNGIVSDKENIWSSSIRKCLDGFEKDGKFYPLCDFIIEDREKEYYLNAVENKDYDVIFQLPFVDRIVNDLRLTAPDEKLINMEKKALLAFFNTVSQDEKVLIWGIKGNLIDQVFAAVLEREKGHGEVIFVDRNSGDGTIAVRADSKEESYPLLNSSLLLDGSLSDARAVVITSIYSGASMHNLLKKRGIELPVLPLFDLADPAWKGFVEE